MSEPSARAVRNLNSDLYTVIVQYKNKMKQGFDVELKDIEKVMIKLKIEIREEN